MVEVEQEVRVWQAAHPTATLAEMERALDQQLRPVRARLLADLAAAAPPAELCPTCGERLVGRGLRTRTLTTQGDEPLALTRRYASCPACGAGLFPPR